MNPSLFNSKPTSVQALQFTGSNLAAVELFVGKKFTKIKLYTDDHVDCRFGKLSYKLTPGDWLVKHTDEFPPIVFNESVFEKSYTLA